MNSDIPLCHSACLKFLFKENSTYMESSKFLKKYLQEYVEKDCYCTGKYVGSIKSFVESFMAVSNSVYRKSSSYSRGKSKRLKENDMKPKSKPN